MLSSSSIMRNVFLSKYLNIFSLVNIFKKYITTKLKYLFV